MFGLSFYPNNEFRISSGKSGNYLNILTTRPLWGVCVCEKHAL